MAKSTSFDGRNNDPDLNRVYAQSGAISVRCKASDNISTLAGLYAIFEGAQILYELATPVEYDLADVQQIKTLLGENNIFTDTNGDVDVIYRANTALYIKKELEA